MPRVQRSKGTLTQSSCAGFSVRGAAGQPVKKRGQARNHRERLGDLSKCSGLPGRPPSSGSGSAPPSFPARTPWSSSHCRTRHAVAACSARTAAHEAPSPLCRTVYGAPHLAADAINFPYHLATDRAHVVMLWRAHRVPCGWGGAPPGAGRCRGGGRGRAPLRPELDDLFTCIEAHLRRDSRGRRSADAFIRPLDERSGFMAIARMVARDRINRVIEQIVAELQATLLTQGRAHAGTVLAGYTDHSQQAQPVTYGHFVLGHHDALESRRRPVGSGLWAGQPVPLGGAALAGTGFRSTESAWRASSGSTSSGAHRGRRGSRDFQLGSSPLLSPLPDRIFGPGSRKA